MDAYDEIAARLKDEKERYNQQLMELTANDKSFELDASTLLWVAQHARQLFASLKVEQKTRFLSLLLSNLGIKQKTVLPSLLEPFNCLFEASKSSKTSNWLPPAEDFANSVTSYDRGSMMMLKDVFLELGIEVMDVNKL